MKRSVPPPGTHPSAPRPVLLNLSNHPYEQWGDAQRKAAQALAPEVQDWPFPAVPPEASLEEVEALAKATVAQLPAGLSQALVMGEHTLVPCLVALLQQRGVTCYATTSVRNSQQDGPHKSSRFDFVAFRPYPRLVLQREG